MVDDNLDAAKTLSLLLRRLGHVVEVAHDGVPCLEKARARSAQVGAPILIVAVTGYEFEV